MNFNLELQASNGLTVVDLFCGAGIGAYERLRVQTVPDDFKFSDDIDFMKQHVRCCRIPSVVAYKLSLSLAEVVHAAGD